MSAAVIGTAFLLEPRAHLVRSPVRVAFARAARNSDAEAVPEGPAFGRERAIEYILEGYPELNGLVNPSKVRTPWLEENLTPERWVGSNIVRYIKGRWTVKVHSAVVCEPVYSVEVVFTGEPSFSWKGSVDQAGNIVVIEFSF